MALEAARSGLLVQQVREAGHPDPKAGGGKRNNSPIGPRREAHWSRAPHSWFWLADVHSRGHPILGFILVFRTIYMQPGRDVRQCGRLAALPALVLEVIWIVWAAPLVKVTAMVLASLSTLTTLATNRFPFARGLAGATELVLVESVCAFVENADRVRAASRMTQIFASDFIIIFVIDQV